MEAAAAAASTSERHACYQPPAIKRATNGGSNADVGGQYYWETALCLSLMMGVMRLYLAKIEHYWDQGCDMNSRGQTNQILKP
eukprot:scaffold199537_cov17-Tisochrysis_lutea.AAC.2